METSKTTETTTEDSGSLLSGESKTTTTEQTTPEQEAATAEETRRAALTDEQRAAEDQAKADEAKKLEVPEEYADFTMPDGVVVDAELMAEFKPFAKELKLTQDQAQKLIDLQTQSMLKMSTSRIDAWKETQQKWIADLKADKEFGGDKYDETISTAKRALNTFAPKESNPEIYKMLDEYGIGNNGEFIKLFARIGNAMKEDTIIHGGNKTPETDVLAKMFPSTQKK